MDSSKLEAILKDRGEVYGPADHNMRSTGHIIRGILEAHFQIKLPGEIPPHIVAAIFVGSKLARIAVPFKFNEDNFDDAHNYLTLGARLDPRNQPAEIITGVIPGSKETPGYGVSSRMGDDPEIEHHT